MKRWLRKKKVFFLVLLCPVFVMLMFFLDELVRQPAEQDPTKKIVAMEKDLYGAHGLQPGQELSQEPFYEDERIVMYSDRLFTLFAQEEEAVQNAGAALEQLREYLPAQLPLYVLPVPPRGATVEQYGEEEYQYTGFITALQQAVGKAAQLVDVAPVLRAHSEEYVFFRTENAWTARGAYYAASLLCQQLDIVSFPLASYNEFSYNEFIGSLHQEETSALPQGSDLQTLLSNIPDDKIYYYTLPSSRSLTQLWQEKDGVLGKESRPTISKADAGVNTFVGASYLWAEVEGDALSENKKDSALLLLCDAPGQMLAPYLANYYKTVYVVSITRYDDFIENLPDFLRNYPVEACVLAQSADEMGLGEKSLLMNRLMHERTQAKAQAALQEAAAAKIDSSAQAEGA